MFGCMEAVRARVHERPQGSTARSFTFRLEHGIKSSLFLGAVCVGITGACIPAGRCGPDVVDIAGPFVLLSQDVPRGCPRRARARCADFVPAGPRLRLLLLLLSPRALWRGRWG